jgi:hypothetical protein
MSTKYADDVIPICTKCDILNELKICKKCHIQYCKHFASVTDYQFCGNCIADVHLVETILEKTIEHERPDGTISFSRKFLARRLRLVNNDWLFMSHLIGEMTDAEIEASVEYHRANVDLMLQERESRKQERYRKLAGIKISKPGESQEQRDKRIARSNKKTSVKEKDPAQIMLDALTALANSGMSAEQIVAALGGKK